MRQYGMVNIFDEIGERLASLEIIVSPEHYLAVRAGSLGEVVAPESMAAPPGEQHRCKLTSRTDKTLADVVV